MSRARLSVMCITVLTACNTAPGVMGPNFDGNWRLAGSAIPGFTCFTILNNQIIQMDDGCIGRSNAIISNQPAVISGNRAIWSFIFQGDSGLVSNLNIDVTMQPDGSLVGTATFDAILSDNIVMNRI